MKKEATEAGQKCWLGPCRRHLYFQAPLPALDGIISPRCLGSHPVRRTKANPGAVSGEAAIRPLIAKAVQLMSKPPETTHFSHEWRRVATWVLQMARKPPALIHLLWPGGQQKQFFVRKDLRGLRRERQSKGKGQGLRAGQAGHWHGTGGQNIRGRLPAGTG